MSGHELNPDWILSDPTASLETRSRIDNELITVARQLWPRIQAHARREFVSGSLDDNLALATEVWESVLQSVSKTLHRTNVSLDPSAVYSRRTFTQLTDCIAKPKFGLRFGQA